MENNNILSGGVETLTEIKQNMLALYESKSRYHTLVLEEEKLERSIQHTEKSVEEEVSQTIKKRRKEIEDTFEEQINKTKAKIKRTNEKRDKRKSLKVSERINIETAELKEENIKLKLEIKALFSQKKVPAISNTRLYYALYSPSGIIDAFIILCTVLNTLLLLPSAIYFLAIPEENAISLIIIYFITVVLVGGAYLKLGNMTKVKHPEEIQQGKQIRNSIRINNKKINIKKKSIMKDMDESNYGLEQFDEQLKELEHEVKDISEQKRDALLIFDNTTSNIIATEMKGIHEEELSGLRREYEDASTEVKKVDERVKSITIKLANDYEPFIGKDFMTVDRLDILINIIKAGTADTISEAITFYKRNMS